MGSFYKHIIRPFLFKQDPERSHDLGVFCFKTIGRIAPLVRLMEYYNRVPMQPVELFGLKFPNRVGIAAGFDKNAECFRAALAFGFGHIELGTVTREKQPGNAKPRLFRYPEQQAIVNRMGFNNDGAEIIADRLSKSILSKKKRKFPVGINIGKSKSTPLEDAAEDFIFSFNSLADYADYFTINVSSPNTPKLRQLQTKDYLPNLLTAISKINGERAKKMGVKKIPLLLKIAPDLSYKELDFVLETMISNDFSGVVATNTTLQRPDSVSFIEESGGLSGKPLFPISLNTIKYVNKATGGKLPIIGCGGIQDPVSASKTMDAGASLIQVYSGIVYEGPFLGAQLAKALTWTQASDWV